MRISSLKKSGVIQLTAIGKLLVNEMKKIVDTVDILENNYEYWTSRDFSAIPDHLFKKIDQLCPCQIAESHLNEMFEFRPECLEGMRKSKYVFAYATFIHPSYPSIFWELAQNNIQTSVVLTKNAVIKLKVDFKDNYETFLRSERSSMHSIGDMKKPGMIVNDNFILLWLFNDKGDFEPRYMISQSQDAIDWGIELFKYYQTQSEEVIGFMYSS